MAPMARVLIYGIIPMPAFALGALYLWYDIQGALGVSLSFSHILSTSTFLLKL